jgi:hypothetical protein
MKLTKRKGFNFFRSYYDVYNELSDKDKVQFMDALLDRQFLGVKPNGLKGMSKFAYISQTNSIDSQVKGYNDKAQSLGTPPLGGALGGAVGVNEKDLTPTLQVQEKGKGKGKVKSVFSFSEFWEIYPKKIGRKDCETKYSKIKEADREIIKKTINNFVKHKPFDDYTHPNPSTYINQERWHDVLTHKQNLSSGFVMAKF